MLQEGVSVQGFPGCSVVLEQELWVDISEGISVLFEWTSEIQHASGKTFPAQQR